MKKAVSAVPILLVATLVACTESGHPPLEPQAGSAAKASKGQIDTDSRATILFDDALSVRSDGKGSYAGEVCGVRAKIFNHDQDYSQSGDLVFDADWTRDRTCADAPRKIVFHDGTPLVSGAFVNVQNIWSVAAGETTTRRVVFDETGIEGCDRLLYWEASVARQPDTSTGARSWVVESQGEGICQVRSRGTYVENGSAAFSFRIGVLEIPFSG